MSFETIALTPRIATEIRTDKATLVGGRRAAEIRELLEQRGVLVFREINLSDDEQLAFTRSIGEVRSIMDMAVFKISLDPAENPAAETIKGSFLWHIDGTNDEAPSRASFLSARRLSETGGQTLFANTYAAYDDLSAADKAVYEKLRVIHSVATNHRRLYPNPTPEQVAMWLQSPPKSHPLVWHHQSGRKSLVLGSTCSHIEGWDKDDSYDLLEKLTGWATGPEFVYCHDWRVGDLVVWDNTGTMHRATPYAEDSGRLMHRTSLIPEEQLI